MIWWVSFIIAIVGWYFTATQNAKNSARTLINQEIKEARTKLHELIVLCTSDESEFPFKPMSEEYLKLQRYLESAKELDTLYSSYCSSSFGQIKATQVLLATLSKCYSHGSLKWAKQFINEWFVPQKAPKARAYQDFDLPEHMRTIRQTLTYDTENLDEVQRLHALNLQYIEFCRAYQFVS